MSERDKAKRKEYNRNYYLKNKEKILLKNKTWIINNRDKHGLSTAKYIRNHKEKVKLLNQKNYQKSKEHINGKQRLRVRKLRDAMPHRYLWKIAKARARFSNIEFNIEPADIIIPDVCPILEIPLRFSDGRTPNTPSLDRIDNAKGYTKENIAVISWRANLLKNNLTTRQIQRLCEYTFQR